MHKSMHKFTFPLYKNSISNPRLLDALSSLIKLDLLARDQALLQCAADANGRHSTFETHRGRGVVQTAGCELVGLGDESLAEPSVVVRRDFASDTARLIDVDQVRGWLRVDSKFASSASDFGGCSVSTKGLGNPKKTTIEEKKKKKKRTYNLPDPQPSFDCRRAGQYDRHRTRQFRKHCLGHCTCAIPGRRL